MLDTVFGVPTHALVVHAVVVLLPLAALGGIAVALVPALRRRYGTVVGLLTVAAVAAVPVATRSGERLFERQSARFGPNDVTEAGLMEEHATLGEDLLPWALLLLAGVALVVVPPLLTRRRERELAPAGPHRPHRPQRGRGAGADDRRAPRLDPAGRPARGGGHAGRSRAESRHGRPDRARRLGGRLGAAGPAARQPRPLTPEPPATRHHPL